MITRICEQCEKTYDTFPSIRLRFCSRECANAHKTKGSYSPCLVCGEQVWSYPGRKHEYCSRSCSRTAANLTSKNPSFSKDISGDKNPMYGKGMVGPDNPMYGKKKELSPRWKGGRKTRKDGYVIIVAPDDHPFAYRYPKTGVKTILEHRFIMERHLGRYLTPDEVVHHIDENPSNNDISNLRLYSSQAEHVHLAHGKD